MAYCVDESQIGQSSFIIKYAANSVDAMGVSLLPNQILHLTASSGTERHRFSSVLLGCCL